ncbi:AraC-like DNA-binding protein [Streptomyces aurantiacus]|uniref:AraC-like ligand-binding domain-containing protein n=1 Tax=Streptomyces aurantiacus TaxID=47760 RepID=UPI00278D09EC|nr:helix-turn-helix domain-containing protein [Streptomyces aurantiacus]MDQ0773220.1 AraC-like DNA-binding protein [Streptomyces aurantiacus]
MSGAVIDSCGPVRILRTQEASVHRGFHAWGDLVSDACGPLRVYRTEPGTFQGAIAVGTFGTVQLAEVQAGPHAVERTELLAGRATTTPLYLTCVLDGEVRVSQGGQTAVARPGNLFSYDSSRPFTLWMRRPIHMVSVKFDHHLVDLRVGLEHPLRAATWCGARGASVLLADLLRSAASHMAELDAAVADQLGSSVASLVGAVCSEKLGEAGRDPGLLRQALLHRIKTFARARLGSPELNPLFLARSHRISLRYLQLLFQDEDTSPALWIRNERLQCCRKDLSDPRTVHLTVANIAERWGLDSASHFSKLFRERYGVTPREWRRTSLLGPV